VALQANKASRLAELNTYEKRFVMSKLLSASLLALGVMYAMPAVANSVLGGRLYIQDVNESVVFTFGDIDGKHQSYAFDNNSVWVRSLDSNGNFVEDNWMYLFRTQGATNDIATIDLNSMSDLPGKPGDPYSFVYTPHADAVELVFMWSNSNVYHPGSYYSDVLYDMGYRSRPKAGSYTEVTYYDSNRAVLGLEDFGGNIDYDDVLITITNVGGTIPPLPPPPAIPEPETYAMLLAGLGLVGAMVRRRRNDGW
jgi:hypothetical protein